MSFIWTVDAFTEDPFKGNPAGVCIVNEYTDDLCQNIAMEMNHAETAFLKKLENNKYFIRWWTPTTEVKLCGHATLASAHLLYSKNYINSNQPLTFKTKYKGNLMVTKKGNGIYEMNFPVPKETKLSEMKVRLEGVGILKAFGLELNSKVITNVAHLEDDLIIEVSDAKYVRNCQPNIELIKGIDVGKGKYRCCVLTSNVNTDKYDYICRVFGPNAGVNEDPVTGSSNVLLAYYWSNKLNKCNTWLNGYQASKRGGQLKVKYDTTSNRINVLGNAVTVLEGKLNISCKL